MWLSVKHFFNVISLIYKDIDIITNKVKHQIDTHVYEI